MREGNKLPCSECAFIGVLLEHAAIARDGKGRDSGGEDTRPTSVEVGNPQYKHIHLVEPGRIKAFT